MTPIPYNFKPTLLEQITRATRGTVMYLGLALCVPAGLTFGLHGIASFQKELSPQEVEQIVEEQQQRLGIEGKIDLQMSPTPLFEDRLAAIALRHPNAKDSIILMGKGNVKEVFLRHELAHLAMHREYTLTGGETVEESIKALKPIPRGAVFERLYHIVVTESQANLYALTGIGVY